MDSISAIDYTTLLRRSSDCTFAVPARGETSDCTPGIFEGVTLADRLKWILANRSRPSGREWKPTPLSLAAGLGRNHVAQILSGRVQDPDTATLEAIAATAGVSAAWLVVGTGSPDDEAPTASQSPPPPLRFGELPTWRELLASAKLRHPNFPAWVWERTARSFPLDGATPNAAAYAAQGILDQTLPPESRTTP